MEKPHEISNTCSPLLSVIIPCYNNGQLLIKMINCCLNQNYINWELLIVDDCSSDNLTQDIVRKYSLKDSRIHLYIRDRLPKGSVTCRNIGLENSKGKYILHLDADDLITETCFENRVKYMESHPYCDFASFPAKSFIKESEIVPDISSNDEIWGIKKGKYVDDLEAFLKADYPYSTWCNIYRKESIKNIKWDENIKIYTDLSFIFSCIMAGLRHEFSNLGKVDYYYRKAPSENAMTSSFISQEKCDSTLVLYRHILEGLNNKEDGQVRLNQFKGLINLHFKRLLLSLNTKNIQRYISLLEEYYPANYIFQLNLAKNITKRLGYNRFVLKLLGL